MTSSILQLPRWWDASPLQSNPQYFITLDTKNSNWQDFLQTTTADSPLTTINSEILSFLYNCISGCTDANIDRYVTFGTHGQSHSNNPTLVLKPAYCEAVTFQALLF